MLEIDLGNAPGPLDGNEFVPVFQALVTLGNLFKGQGFVSIVLCHIHVADRPALDNHLAARVRIGFQQHRVHVCVGIDAACLGLNSLGPSDLTPFGGDAGVEGHVL